MTCLIFILLAMNGSHLLNLLVSYKSDYNTKYLPALLRRYRGKLVCSFCEQTGKMAHVCETVLK